MISYQFSSGPRNSVQFALLLLSIATGLQGFSRVAAAQTRHYGSVNWKIVGGVKPADSLLLNPIGIAADSQGLYVYDAGDFRVKAFTWSGQKLWTLGREGSGPGEFRNISALALSPEGYIWAYDNGNARITIITPSGQIHRQFSMPHSLLPSALQPLGGGRFLAQAFVRSPFLVLFDSNATELMRYRAPADFGGRDMIQTRLVAGSAPRSWSLWSSVYTDRLFFIDLAKDSILAVRGIRMLDFPKTQAATIRTPDGKSISGVRPDPSNVSAGIALAELNGRVIVLMGSASSAPFRTLDTYSLPSGRYIESLLLPEVCNNLTVAKRIVVCVQFDPAPQIKAWQLNSQEKVH